MKHLRAFCHMIETFQFYFCKRLTHWQIELNTKIQDTKYINFNDTGLSLQRVVNKIKSSKKLRCIEIIDRMRLGPS